MKINYNGFKPMPVSAGVTIEGLAYQYTDYYYMRIKLKCAGLTIRLTGNKSVPFVNLRTGGIRLLASTEDLYPLQSKVQLRQGHTHEELST